METEKTNTNDVEWVLCSPIFDDIVHITPKGLDLIPVESNYLETSVKHIKRFPFSYTRSTQKKTIKKHNETINKP